MVRPDVLEELGVHQVASLADPEQINLAFVLPITAIFDGELIVANDGDRIVLPLD